MSRVRVTCTGSALRAAGLALLLFPAVGCHTVFEVKPLAYALVEREPDEAAVHQYPGLSHPPVVGPLVAVFLVTQSDLVLLAPSRTHHLYFEVLPCSRGDHQYSLYVGCVFLADENERQALRPLLSSGDNLYKVHVPFDLASLIDFASGCGTLDVDRYLETARRDGLCLRVGGAKAWGVVSLFSKLAPAPLMIRGDSLVLDPRARKLWPE